MIFKGILRCTGHGNILLFVVGNRVPVAIVTFVSFLPALDAGFVTWDDDKNFLANTAYRGLGWQQLTWMWTTFHLGHYVPLSWMTLGLDYSLWGMEARGYHLTSLIIHAANAQTSLIAYGYDQKGRVISETRWLSWLDCRLGARFPLDTMPVGSVQSEKET